MKAVTVYAIADLHDYSVSCPDCCDCRAHVEDSVARGFFYVTVEDARASLAGLRMSSPATFAWHGVVPVRITADAILEEPAR